MGDSKGPHHICRIATMASLRLAWQNEIKQPLHIKNFLIILTFTLTNRSLSQIVHLQQKKIIALLYGGLLFTHTKPCCWISSIIRSLPNIYHAIDITYTIANCINFFFFFEVWKQNNNKNKPSLKKGIWGMA
jgi:hypothetical protein